MRKSTKLITGLSVAGLAVVAGSAFTGAGLTTGVQAGQAQFIGGTVSQEVEGAELRSLVYGFGETDATKTSVQKVTLKFSGEAAGKNVGLKLTVNGTVQDFTCSTATTTELDTALFDCGTTTTTTNADGTTTVTGVSGVTNASVTVGSVNAS